MILVILVGSGDYLVSCEIILVIIEFIEIEICLFVVKFFIVIVLVLMLWLFVINVIWVLE